MARVSRKQQRTQRRQRTQRQQKNSQRQNRQRQNKQRQQKNSQRQNKQRRSRKTKSKKRRTNRNCTTGQMGGSPAYRMHQQEGFLSQANPHAKSIPLSQPGTTVNKPIYQISH